VPELVLDGTIAVDDALLVDDVTDVEALVAAHRKGVPVVVRAATREAIVAALSRPEVACVLVPREELLALDLSELLYG
jgi:hypothetical protein